jgi:DNA uptake protein ComE-like DNA-binding protein
MKNLITLITLSLILSPLTAADKKGTTAKKTDPVEKKASETDQTSAKAAAAAKTLTPSQKTKLMEILNAGDDKAIQSLPGIGPVTSAAIIKGRPYADSLDVLKVDGIGEATFVKLVAHAKAGFPVKEPKPDAKKPASGEKEEGKGKSKKSAESTKKNTEPAE